MGTHPIFESDFDCLTDYVKNTVTMSQVYKVDVYVSNGDAALSTKQRPIKARIVIPQEGHDIEYHVEGSEKKSALRQVRIERARDGFGISIKGGKEHNRPLIISKCDARHKEIKVGDRIVSCNGKSMLNSNHSDAVEAIRGKCGEEKNYVQFELQGDNWEKREIPIQIPEIYRPVTSNCMWMTRLSRASKYGENAIEIASPCLQSRFVITAESEKVANHFVKSFQKAKMAANVGKFEKLNQLIEQSAVVEFSDSFLNTKDCQIHNMDWFHGSIGTEEKKHYLVILTQTQLRFYFALPTKWKEWNEPVKTISLISTRAVIYKGNLLLRVGTKKEAEVLDVRCSSASTWHDEIHRQTRACVSKVKEAQVEVIFENETGYLGIHWTEGLKLFKAPNRKLHWHKTIANLSSIDDDNQSNLILSFKDKSKYTLVLGDGLRPFIFLMLNFVETQFEEISNNNINNNKTIEKPQI